MSHHTTHTTLSDLVDREILPALDEVPPSLDLDAFVERLRDAGMVHWTDDGQLAMEQDDDGETRWSDVWDAALVDVDTAAYEEAAQRDGDDWLDEDDRHHPLGGGEDGYHDGFAVDVLGDDIWVVWSQALAECPGCGQSDRPAERDCPVSLQANGDVWQTSQQHGCGHWWGPVAWQVVEPVTVDHSTLSGEPIVTRAAVTAAGREVAADWRAEIDAVDRATRSRLLDDLACYIVDVVMAAECGDDLPAANAETMPGIYWDGVGLVAWAGSADGETWADGHMVEVTPDDLRAEGLDRWDLTEGWVAAALAALADEDAR